MTWGHPAMSSPLRSYNRSIDGGAAEKHPVLWAS